MGVVSTGDGIETVDAAKGRSGYMPVLDGEKGIYVVDVAVLGVAELVLANVIL